jgi:hypothetical protein
VTVPCTRCNVVHVRRQGERTVIYRCANAAAPFFTQDVTAEQCQQCPVRPAPVVVEGRVPKVPSLPRRLMTWAEATVEWVAKGRPERSDEEVARIHTVFCASSPPCRWYSVAQQQCQKCGCGVKAEGPAIFNKIKMATQHCPRNLW